MEEHCKSNVRFSGFEMRERDLSWRFTKLYLLGDGISSQREGGEEIARRLYRNANRLNKKRRALVEKAKRRGVFEAWDW